MKRLSSIVTVATFVAVVFGAPLYDVAHGSWPGRGVDADVEFETVRSGELARQIERELRERTQLDDLMWPRYNELRYVATGETNTGVVIGRNGWLFPSERLGEPGESLRAELLVGTRAMGDIARDLEARGCRVVFELVPRKRSLFPEELPTGRPFVPLFELVRDAMLAEGLRVPDLRVPLSQRDPLLYLTNDTHWKPEGCHAAARVIARTIRDLFPNGEVPGEPLQLEFRRGEPIPFTGYLQRMLGFAGGGWLDRQFDDDMVLVHAVRREPPGRAELGSTDPQPVLLVGTSMSRVPYNGASQLAGHLGVQVEDHSYDGYPIGYRLAEIYREILTGARPVPEVLVWEFPEDFPIREGRYFFEPLHSILAVANGKYDVVAIPEERLALTDMTVERTENGTMRGRTRSPDAAIAVDLPRAVAGDEGAVFCIDSTVPTGNVHRGRLVVEWSRDAHSPALGQRSVVIRITSWLHPVIVPLTAPVGATIGHVRVRPFDAATDVEFGNVQLWTRR